MESHQPDEENKTQPQPQPTATQPPPPPPVPPVRGEQAGNVPAMGYPPPMYPSAPSGYYQPPRGYNPYPYAQAPPATYYQPAMPPPQTAKGSPFARAILLSIVVLVMLMCASSIITWLVLRPEIPTVELSALSVYNFNVTSINATSSEFAANWVVNLTVHNTNTKLSLSFDRLQTLIFYKGDYLVSTSYVAPFYMTTRTTKTVAANMTAREGYGEGPVEKGVLENMDSDRRQGEVVFAVRMLIVTVLKSGSWWSRRVVFTAHCEGIRVKFMGRSGNVVLSPHDAECLVLS